MPGLVTEQIEPGDSQEWREGFAWFGGALSCDRCGASVPFSPERANLHRAWHAELDKASIG